MRQTIFNCLTCNNSFYTKKKSKNRTPKYCSKKCYSESLKIKKSCKLCGGEIKGNGSSVSNRIYCSKKCQSDSRRNKELNDEWKKKISEARKKSDKCKGENLYNWRGGESTFLIRSKEYFYKRKKNLKLKMPLNYLKRLIKEQNNKCFFCDSDLTNYKAIEHLTPVSKGGDNQPYNLVYSCKSCNSKKRQMTLEEYSIKNKRFDLIDKFDTLYASAIY